MKKAVVTITVGPKYEALSDLTHPTIKAYAKRIGADFIVWRDFIGHSLPAFKKLDIHKLLDEYDRVIFLDTDLIVRDDCPDLFSIVPEDTFGAFNEFPFTDRAQSMMAYRQSIDWVMRKSYYNTGVFVCSRAHKAVFAPVEEVNNFYEQTGLNWQIYAGEFKTMDLSHKFNRMTCLDWTGESRFDSYIMHYAGCPLSGNALVQQIKADLSSWETRPSHYPRKIHFDANGGLGDQVCAEPVIRYLKSTVYAQDDVIVTTHYPELFDHLDVEVARKGEAKAEPGRTYFSISLPPESATYNVNNHILTHPIEAASLAAFKGQMPPLDKSIQLKGHPISSEVEDIARKSILVHAGRSWQTKTFPASFWNALISGLNEAGIEVALIGKNVDADFGYVDLGTYQSPMVHDLRDKLSIGQLISVIDCATRGLISNDSSPVHIAGAFYNPIHLITIAKADFRILPFRHGIQEYRAHSYGKLMPFRFDANCPTEVRVDRASEEEIRKHLPSVTDILTNVLHEIDKDSL